MGGGEGRVISYLRHVFVFCCFYVCVFVCFFRLDINSN